MGRGSRASRKQKPSAIFRTEEEVFGAGVVEQPPRQNAGAARYAKRCERRELARARRLERGTVATRDCLTITPPPPQVEMPERQEKPARPKIEITVDTRIQHFQAISLACLLTGANARQAAERARREREREIEKAVQAANEPYGVQS